MGQMERVKEWLEHSLWVPWDELGQLEQRESVLSQVQELMELSRMKMKLRALLWALASVRLSLVMQSHGL